MHSHPVRRTAAACAALVALTLAAYAPLWDNGFSDLDDPLYITENPRVLGGLTRQNVAWAWTTLHAGYWQPMTWMSLQLDASLFSRHPPGRPPVPVPAGFHAMNLFWHTATTLLLFLVLQRLTGEFGCSLAVAALFAVHPLHVESVAWACERKDTLSTFFWVLTIALYARYAAAPGWFRYLPVLLSFGAGLLAKPMLVTLPCTLLLLDYWPLGRFQAGVPVRTVVLEKVPLFLLAAGMSVLTFLAQRWGGGISPLEGLPPVVRLGHAVYAYGWYLAKTLWPAGLMPLHPHPGRLPPLPALAAATAVLMGVTVLAVAARQGQPWLLVGWLWFLGTLFPVIGLVQSGNQGFADRFSYVPHIGLFVAVVWTVRHGLGRWGTSWAPRAALATAAVAVLTGVTRAQVMYWHDPETLWQHGLAVSPDNAQARYFFGKYLLPHAGPAAAVPHLQEAVRLVPDCIDYRVLYGMALFWQGEYEESVEQLHDITRRDPGNYTAWFWLGEVRSAQRLPQSAAACYERANAARPRDTASLAALGHALWKTGRRGEARRCWDTALQSNPREDRALLGHGLVRLREGQNAEAAQFFAAACAISLQAETVSLLGLALGRAGRWAEAAQAQEKAVELEEVRLGRHTRRDETDLALYRRRLDAARKATGTGGKPGDEPPGSGENDPEDRPVR